VGGKRIALATKSSHKFCKGRTTGTQSVAYRLVQQSISRGLQPEGTLKVSGKVSYAEQVRLIIVTFRVLFASECLTLGSE
jgi:hypothetical protein